MHKKTWTIPCTMGMGMGSVHVGKTLKRLLYKVAWRVKIYDRADYIFQIRYCWEIACLVVKVLTSMACLGIKIGSVLFGTTAA